MRKYIYISEETISDDKQIYLPDLNHHNGKDYSVPLGGSWTTIPELVKKNFFITSIQPIHGDTIRWKITVNQFDVVE